MTDEPEQPELRHELPAMDTSPTVAFHCDSQTCSRDGLIWAYQRKPECMGIHVRLVAARDVPSTADRLLMDQK